MKYKTKKQVLSKIDKEGFDSRNIHPSLLEDRDIVFLLAQRGMFNSAHGLPEQYRTDKEIVLAWVKEWGIYNLEAFVAGDLLSDREVAFNVLSRYFYCIKDFPKFQDDKEFILDVLSQNTEKYLVSRGFTSLSERMQEDIDVVLAYVARCVTLYEEVLPDRFKNDPVVVSAVVDGKNTFYLEHIPEEFKTHELVYKACIKSFTNFKHVPEEFRTKEFLLSVLEKRFIGPSMNQKDYISEWFIEESGFGHFISDKDVALALLAITPFAITIIPASLRKKANFMKAAAKVGVAHYQTVFSMYPLDECKGK